MIHRLKSGIDAATPSGNGTAALALLALAEQLDAPQAANYRTAAERCVRAFAATVRSDPASHTRLLYAAARLQTALGL